MILFEHCRFFRIHTDLCAGGKLYTTARICLAARSGMSRFPDARFLVSAAARRRSSPAMRARRSPSRDARTPASRAPSTRLPSAARSPARARLPGRTRLLNFFELRTAGTHRRSAGIRVRECARRASGARWAPLIEALRARRSLRGLFPDRRCAARHYRGRRGGHSLERSATARRARAAVESRQAHARRPRRRACAMCAAGLQRGSSVQLFSAHAGTGVAEAQEKLIAWLADKKTPVTSSRSPGQTNPAQVS